MRFLIIDNDPDYQRALRYHLDARWPDSVVEQLLPDPAESMTPADIDVGGFDVVLLGHPLPGEKGFAWLRSFRGRPRCPPVLVFAEPSDELIAVDAMKAGAASFFPKSRVTHQRLIDTIRQELDAAGRGFRDAQGMVGKKGRGKSQEYEYLEVLHASRIASVYLARTEPDGRLAACKVLHYVPDSGGEGLFDRFLQEYEIIATIDHPNVVRIYDLGIADDHAYIAMEYLAAGNLAARLSRPLSIDVALDYTRQIAGALRAIHAKGVLHRDLKPANIMFREDESLALIDFGLAKNLELSDAITGTGEIFGTPYYMSPEQGHAERTDHRSDIYSLGCILYEMLTGERPFVGASAMSVIYKHAHAPRPRLRRGADKLQRLIDGMLAIRPGDRYQSAADLMTELDQ
jgi:eukaryotic-like serine/threonine-protein kinase